jgi:hypothetical protein
MPETPTPDRLAAARYDLREWARCSHLVADLPENVIVAAFRMEAIKLGWELRDWQQDIGDFRAQWYRRTRPEGLVFQAATLDAVHLLACGHLACALPELAPRASVSSERQA